MGLLSSFTASVATNIRLASLAVVGSILVILILTKRRSRPLPAGTRELPGPKGIPIVGSALDIPKTHAWLKFTEWSKEYGPIYQVNAFGTVLVVISKESITNDLLSLRGAIYSDRPTLVMTSLISENGFLGALKWSDYWRRGRRFTQSMLSSSMVSQSIPKQTTEARQMVVDVAKEPSRYAYWLERAGVNTSMKQIYGLSEERGPTEEHHVHEICSYMEHIERVSTPGAYLVEFLPWLLYLPDWVAPFKREAKALAKRHWAYMSSLVEASKEQLTHGASESPESFTTKFIRDKEEWKLSDREAVWVFSSIYGGASGTSSAAVQTIMLNTLLFPEWQRRVQDEIDSQVGGDRLPDFDDFSSLPILRAVIKESIRWRPVLSGGFPHSVIKDDVYNGYHIPQGSVIIANQWGMLREEELYPESESFNPDRWLKPGYPTYREPLTQYPNLQRFAAFGHGRRICPGLEVAEKAIFLQAASLYWACSIVKQKEGGGKDIEVPWYDYTGVAISSPRPFPFAVEERGEGRLKMMNDAAQEDHERDKHKE